MDKTTRILSSRSRRFCLVLICCIFAGFHIHCKKASTPQADSSINSNIENLEPPKETLLIAGQSFTVELAYTCVARQKGLMFRSQLAPQTGMIFIFAAPDVHSFHMNNCLIDLDILFIDESGKIVHLTTMAAPPPGKASKIYSSQIPVKYALELPAGTIQKLDLKVDQFIPIPKRLQSIIPEPD